MSDPRPHITIERRHLYLLMAFALGAAMAWTALAGDSEQSDHWHIFAMTVLALAIAISVLVAATVCIRSGQERLTDRVYNRVTQVEANVIDEVRKIVDEAIDLKRSENLADQIAGEVDRWRKQDG